ncbi:MAG: exosortase/archaeosortase family protein, partial [Pseudomonadota bacterium]
MAVVAGILGLALFLDPIQNLFQRWGTSEELSHSYFIPLISAWLIWTNKEAIGQSIGKPSLVGLFLIIAALVLRLLGELIHFYFLQQVGLIVFIAGVAAGLGGRSLLRILAAPIGFLIFAVPPPNWVMTLLSLEFQHISSELGVAMLRWANVPV